MGWFSWGRADIDASLKTIDKRLEAIVATLREVLSNIKNWGTSWRDRALAAETVAAAEKQRGDNLQAALDAAIADDAVTDQQQIADAVAAATADDNAAVEQAWAELQALDAPPQEPPAETPDEPVVVEPTE